MTDLLELAKRTLADVARKSEDPETGVVPVFEPATADQTDEASEDKTETGAAPLVDLDAPVLVYARKLLNRSGVRKFMVDGEVIVGIWSDLDSPEIRSALRVLESDCLLVRYLDGPGVPVQYKLRSVPGEATPLDVLTEMGEHLADPWIVRDRMLTAMGWCVAGTPWADWQTVRDGEK